MKAGPLPRLSKSPLLEPRGALWVSVDVGGIEIQLVNTHLGLNRRERLLHVEALLGPEWLGNPACREPLVFLGDLNAVPRSRTYMRVAAQLQDAQRCRSTLRPRATFPSRFPFLRIDHVFVSRSIDVLDVQVGQTPTARVASDHLPLIVDFRVLSRETDLQSYPAVKFALRQRDTTS